eukprot:scpid74841/ scgid17556/ 
MISSSKGIWGAMSTWRRAPFWRDDQMRLGAGVSGAGGSCDDPTVSGSMTTCPLEMEEVTEDEKDEHQEDKKEEEVEESKAVVGLTWQQQVDRWRKEGCLNS